MNAVTRTSASGAIAIPAHLPTPPLPERVASYLRGVELHAETRARWEAASPEDRERMFVSVRPQPPILRHDEREEAQRALRAIDRETAPVPYEVFRAWLGPVNAAVRNPQPQEDFEIRCRGLHTVLDDLPLGAFTADSRRRLPAFFPSAADIRDAVEPDAKKLLATITGLRASLNAKPVETPTFTPDPPAQPSERTPDQIAWARAKTAAIVSELRAIGAAKEMKREQVRASSYCPHQHIAHLEQLVASGNATDATKTRLAALRKQMGVEA